MKRIHRPLSSPALLPAALLPAALLIGGLPAAAHPTGVPGLPDDGSTLAEFVDAPEVYFELFDIGDLERDLRGTGLGRLTKILVPFCQQASQGAEMPPELSAIMHGTFMPLCTGDLSCEEALATTLADLAEQHLGMSSEDAVTVAAAVGTRVSFALDMDFDGDRPGEHWAMGLALHPGGDLAIADLLMPRIAEKAQLDLEERVVTRERDARGIFAAWKLEDDLVVLRPGMLAVVSDEAIARRILDGDASSATAGGDDRQPVVTQFQLKRNDSLTKGERAWFYVSGDVAARSIEEGSDREREAAYALGLDRLGGIEAGLAARDGQLISRVTFEKHGPGGVLGLARGRKTDWNGMELLTADTLVVAGLPQSPSVVIDDVRAMLAEAGAGEDSGYAQLGAIVSQNPILAALADRGAFGDETLLFVRPGAAAIPMVYLAARATPQLEQALAGIEGLESDGGPLRVRTKEIDGSPAWVVSAAEAGNQWGLAVMRRDGAVVASYSLLALQDYARQRTREHAEDRQALIDGVRARIAAARRPDVGPERIAGFCHVRVEPLAEWVWPLAMMGMSMSGMEGLEDLPDAVELAEQVGDTTLLLYDFDDRVEVRGRGLLGGLGILF